MPDAKPKFLRVIGWCAIGLVVQAILLVSGFLGSMGEGGAWFACLSGPGPLGLGGWLLLFSLRPFSEKPFAFWTMIIVYTLIVGFFVAVSAGLVLNDGYHDFRAGFRDLSRAPIIGFPALICFGVSPAYLGRYLYKRLGEMRTL